MNPWKSSSGPLSLSDLTIWTKASPHEQKMSREEERNSSQWSEKGDTRERHIKHKHKLQGIFASLGPTTTAETLKQPRERVKLWTHGPAEQQGRKV